MKNLIAIVAGLSLLMAAPLAKSYNWDASTLPVSLQVGDNVSIEWQNAFELAVADWNVTTVLSVTDTRGKVRDPRQCKAREGKIEVCNAFYGENGWLGLTTLTVTGDIIQSAVVRINDTYFSQPTYATEAWRNMVMCHELGHVWGVPHVDESFSNEPAGTCMDYSLDPVPNQRPNNEDYAKLETLYTAANEASGGTTDGGGDTTDGGTTDGGGSSKPCRGKKCSTAFELPLDAEQPNFWGKLVSRHGHHEVYELNMGKQRKVLTFVVKANGKKH